MRISRKANFFNQPVITILRLLLQLQEAKNIARSRDQRVVELQLEADQLREQAARQNSIVSSLKKRIQVVPSPTIYILLFFLSLFILKLYYTYYSTNRIEKLAPRIITNFSLLLNRQKKRSGIRGAREESLRRPREERDRVARLATRLEVSRGKGSRMREEDTAIGAGGTGREGIEGAGPFQFSGFSHFPIKLSKSRIKLN